MSAQLPPEASLRQLKLQAKDLHRARRARDPQAISRFTQHHPHCEQSAAVGGAAFLTLQDAQLVLAREYGFASWPRLVAAVAAQGSEPEPDGLLVGSSAAMRQVRTLVARAAGTRVPVLITGERGTGKRLVAQAIHEASNAAGSLTFLACSGADPAVVETDLCGYEPGAFTGALTPRPGLLEEADGGTLVLEEVAALNPASQARLQAFLERGTVRRLGSAQDLEPTVRLLATSSDDLQAEAAAGTFRHDLYYQLAVLRLDVLPLRERLDDIPALVSHFAVAVTEPGSDTHPTFTAAALARFAAHNWPGNVRELRAAVERAVALSASPIIPAEAVLLPSP